MLQMLAIGRVQDNRDRRREAKAAARLERERGNKEKLDKLAIERKALGLDGAGDSDPAGSSGDGQEHPLTGLTRRGDELVEESDLEERKSGLESDTSVTETSEEEMFV